MASVPSPTVTFRWRDFLTFGSLLMSISILTSNSSSYALHRNPRGYTPLPRRHTISASNESNPNLSSHDHRSFSPFMGQYSRQASSGARSDRWAVCGLWWHRKHLQLRPYPIQGLDTRIWSWILIWLLEMAIIKLEGWLLQWVQV